MRKKTINENLIGKVVRRVLNEMLNNSDNYGWHAGDLGKAEHFTMMSSGSRDTGHFGTGTYFCSSEDKLNGDKYAQRPKHKINLDNYNLLKIKNNDLAFKFHDALKYINNTAFREMHENGTVNEEKLKKACHIIAIMLFGDKIEELPDLAVYRDKVYKKAIELLSEYTNYYKNEFRGKSERNSITTELLKYFGFDGVDVRQCDLLDNTTYGSVIYNLK